MRNPAESLSPARPGGDYRWSRWARWTLGTAIVASVASIAVSEIFLTLTVLLWILDCRQRGRFHLKAPPFTLFLGLFFLAVLVAALLSSDVWASLVYFKKFTKFAYVFLIYTYFDRPQVVATLRGIWALLGVSALYGVLQYFWLMQVDLLHRIEGFMSHWMTYSGQLMLGSVALVALLLFERWPEIRSGRASRARRWEAAAGLALLLLYLLALVLTLTRNAWLGTSVGVLLLLWLHRRRWALLGIAALLALFLVLPPAFQQRFFASFDTTQTTTRIRLELLRTGRNIIRRHPWWGLGPRMVPRLYGQYNTTDEFPSWIYQHLHNDFLHIAASMGLVTLVVWVALWVRVLLDFSRFRRRAGPVGLAGAGSAAGTAVIAAFLTAGLFEYNFGDSEVLILLLFFITIPYVLNRPVEASL